MPREGLTNMTPDDIITAALECIDTPFMHQGRVVGAGLDCVGVAIHVCKRLGLEPSDVVGYGRTPLNGQLESALDYQPFVSRITKDEVRPGDMMLMRFLGEPQHLAIMGNDEVIHAYETVGKCVRHTMNTKWWNRVVHAYRFNEVTV